MFNIARLQRDLRGSSKVGLVYTDRIDGGDSNRVFAADARLLFRIDLQPAAAGRRQPDACRRPRDHGADLAGRVQPRRPAFRLSLPDDGHPRRLSGGQRLHQPERRAHDQPDAPRAPGSARPSAPVQSFTSERARERRPAVPQRHAADPWLEKKLHFNNNFKFAGRMAGRRLRAVRVVRVRRAVLRGLRAARVGPAEPEILPFTGVPAHPQRRLRRSRSTRRSSRASPAASSTSGAATRTSSSGRRPTSCSRPDAVDWRPSDSCAIEPAVSAPVLRAAQRRHHRRQSADPAPARSSTRCRAPIFLRAIGEYDAQPAGRPARRFAHGSADRDPRSRDRRSTRRRWRSSATASASTRCSPISRRRARWSSPATAAC